METTWKHQVTTMFPPGFHSGNSTIPCGFPRNEMPYAPVSGIPLHGNQGETWGFLHGNQGETTWKPQVSKGKHEGNHKETRVSQGKHKGNHMETTSFPKVNHMETPHFRQVSLIKETTALWIPGFPDVETSRKLQVSYKEICGKPHGNPRFHFKKSSVPFNVETCF